jgi:hypothetical protein
VFEPRASSAVVGPHPVLPTGILLLRFF